MVRAAQCAKFGSTLIDLTGPKCQRAAFQEPEGQLPWQAVWLPEDLFATALPIIAQTSSRDFYGWQAL